MGFKFARRASYAENKVARKENEVNTITSNLGDKLPEDGQVDTVIAAAAVRDYNEFPRRLWETGRREYRRKEDGGNKLNYAVGADY